METILINVIEISLMISLIYGVLKYWTWRFNKKNISTNSNIFGLFIFFQISTLIVMIYSAIDIQNQSYIEQMDLFGQKSISIWSVYGIQTFGIAFLFMISNILSILIVKITNPTKTELFEEIKNENYSLILISSVLTLSLGFITSNYILKSVLLNWLTQNVSLIPIH